MTKAGTSQIRQIFGRKLRNLDTYVCEPTGANTTEQNSGAEYYNDTFAFETMVIMLLYGATLPAKYW